GAIVIEQERRGVAAARNAGVGRARGAILAFLDQDDLWTPSKIRRQVSALQARPGHVSLVSYQLFLDPGAAMPAWFARPELLESVQPGWGPSCMAFERATFERVGPFDPRFAQTSDMDWFARAKEKGVAFENIAEALVRRRLHDANDS